MRFLNSNNRKMFFNKIDIKSFKTLMIKTYYKLIFLFLFIYYFLKSQVIQFFKKKKKYF
jgi:hypothetical protein